MKKYITVILLLLLVTSLGFNVFMINIIRGKGKDVTKETLVFMDANSRDTYFSMHNVREAHKITKGKGIKVGILDMYFGYEKYPDLYAGGKDFSDQKAGFTDIDEHGYWMALTLKEIAPEVEVYALGVNPIDEDLRAEQMVQAINWAIEHDLDVLTYSNSGFSAENKNKLDVAVNIANENNIVTTFIWYTNPNNLLPGGLQAKPIADRSEPDIYILHYDYNAVPIGEYLDYMVASEKEPMKSSPFMSYSSTSPVAAGFVALLKSINNDLPPAEYKRILMETSKERVYEGEKCPRVVDIYEAVKLVLEDNPGTK